MAKIKTAYELACERIIVSRHAKERVKVKTEEEEKKLDFVAIPEFSDREDRVIESNETKLLVYEAFKENDEDDEDDDDKELEEIKVVEPETISWDDKVLEVCWNGHFFDYSGFARMNRTMVFGLSDRNVKVKVEIEPYLVHVNKATRNQLELMSKTNVPVTAPKIYGVTIPTDINHPGKKIVYTMIETSDKVHKDYSGKLNLCDEIWVATKYGEKILKNSGVYPPIHVMPLGVDVSRYNSDAGSMDFGSSVKKFKFLSVFRWSYRKGYDVLLRAYMEEFSADDDVSLILVSRAIECSEDQGPKKILEDFNGVKETINKPDEELPHISLYTKPIHERDMPKVYNSGDAFVLISRGEGFGIPYIEAGACGLPVIASNCSGHSDFLHEDNSFLVEPDGYVEVSSSGTHHRMAKLCHFYEGQTFPNFTRKSIEKTKEQMRFVYENQKASKEKAKKLRQLIVNNYTWDMAINRVYNRLREIS